MKLFVDIKSKLERFRAFVSLTVVILNVIFLFMFLNESLDRIYLTIIVSVSNIFMFIFYHLLVILIKQSYYGKILTISRTHQVEYEDSLEKFKHKKELNISKKQKFNGKNALMQFFFNLDSLESPQKFTILRIYRKHIAFIEQIVTKRKHMVDLRYIDVEIET